MDEEKTRRILKAVKKRIRSDSDTQSASKRLKDLYEGDIEDFLYLLDVLDPDKDTPSKTGNEPEVDGHQATMKDNQDLLQMICPMFERLEKNLGAKIDGLNEELLKKDERINELETKVEKLEQFNKRNNLIIHGIPHAENENNKKQIIDFTKEHLNLEINSSDISEAHRIGDKETPNRPIIVKFTNYETRKKVYKNKKSLKDITPKYYVNEDLTPRKAELLKKARQLTKELFIWKTWTINSNIYYTVRQNDVDEEPKTIKNDEDIDQIRRTLKPRIPPRRRP